MTQGIDELRRRWLRFLVTSPVMLGMPAALRAWPERAVPERVEDVLNIAQLDSAARHALPPPTYHFIVDAADDGATLDANLQAFSDRALRPRRLVDVSRVDTSLTLFGQTLSSPILLAPVGNQRLLHADGEIATARAAARRRHLLIASMLTNASIEEITAVPGQYWLQLYPSANRAMLGALLERAADSGCSAIVLTIDGPTRGNHEATRWFRRRSAATERPSAAPLGNLQNLPGPFSIGDASMTWKDLDWLRSQTRLPVILKGIVTREDARLCRRYRIDGVIVSNHGGRQEGSGRGTLDVLPEVVGELRGRVPVLLDGGIRRGSDVFKALALGADAVCIGRPYLWGLGAFGEAGVTKALEILQRELVQTMALAGARSLAAIQRAHVWPLHEPR